MKDLISVVLSVAVVGIVCTYPLVVLDLIRRGRSLRRRKELLLMQGSGSVSQLDGRIPCPECAEAILPQARRCPFCRSVVSELR